MKKGFTLLEIVIVLGLTMLLIAIVFSSLRIASDSLRAKTHQEIYSQLLSASRRARDGAENSDWGLYFNIDQITNEANYLILFAGESYESRDTEYDLLTDIDPEIIFSDISLSDVAPFVGNGFEVSFSATTGEPHQTGSITLQSGEKETLITIDTTGIPIMTYVE